MYLCEALKTNDIFQIYIEQLSYPTCNIIVIEDRYLVYYQDLTV